MVKREVINLKLSKNINVEMDYSATYSKSGVSYKLYVIVRRFNKTLKFKMDSILDEDDLIFSTYIEKIPHYKRILIYTDEEQYLTQFNKYIKRYATKIINDFIQGNL